MRTPAFHLIRTAAGNRWVVSNAPLATRDALDAALRAEPTVPLVALEHTPLRSEGALADLLGAAAALYRGPAFTFPDTLVTPRQAVEIVGDPSGLRTDPELAWVRSASPATWPLCVARNAAGEVVAVCHSSRSHGAAVAAGVETATAYRRGGLGTAVVAGWAAAAASDGRDAFYGTTWTNAASRAIASALGLVCFGEDIHPA